MSDYIMLLISMISIKLFFTNATIDNVIAFVIGYCITGIFFKIMVKHFERG